MRQNKGGVQSLFSLFGRFSLVILLLSPFLFAGSFEHFKRTQQHSFTVFQNEADRTFFQTIKAPWSEYKAQQIKLLYPKQKPLHLPKTGEQSFVAVGPKIYLKVPKLPVEPVTQKEHHNNYTLSFNFFGLDLGFHVEKNFQKARYFPYDKDGVANFFSSITQIDSTQLITKIQTQQKQLRLNDWGVYLIAKNLSMQFFTNEDEQKLMLWFILNKLGYDVKIALNGRHVILLHYSQKTIYATPSYLIKSKRYYALSQNSKEHIGSVYSYKTNYHGATKPLNLSLPALPQFPLALHKKTLHFIYNAKQYNLSFRYNQHIIDFMATYPQADYATFFDAPLEAITYHDLMEGFKHSFNAKKASSGIDFLLKLVQKSFLYEVDSIQFGREKVMFAQETLVYNKSDCEDRSVLFASLVRKIFHINVLGIRYKDHMATALYIPLQGDFVRYGNKKLIVADPTYVNANIGQSMPRYKGIQPEQFIVLQGR